MLPELLDQIPPDQEIATVTADGAFGTRKCHDAIAARGAAAFGLALEPVAGMPSLPPRKNAKPWKPDSAGAIARNEILRTSKRLGRTIWRRWSGYHRRSRVETKTLERKGLCSSGRRVPGPLRRAERLNRARHTRHGCRGMSLSRERGTSAIS